MIKKIPKLSLFFGLLLLAMTTYFLIWGLEYTNHNYVIIFALATIFGIFMAFNVGGNDVANSFGTSVGAKTLTIPQALAIAAVFEVSGAMIAGGAVTDTIRKGVIDLSTINLEPMQFIYIMMSALLAAAIWLLIATNKGFPVSTTHSIIGGIVGSSITVGVVLNGSESAFELVQWGEIGTIAMSWVISPVLGGLASYTLYFMIKKHVLDYNSQAYEKLKEIKLAKKTYKRDHKKNFDTLSPLEQTAYTNALARDAHVKDDTDFDIEDFETDYHKSLHEFDLQKEKLVAHKALQNYVPIIAAIGSVIISAMLIFKGLKNIDLEFSTLNKILIMMMVATSVWMATYILAKTLKGKSLENSTFLMFSWLQVFTASGFAFSHGSNDIANAVGPFAAILDVLKTGDIHAAATVPPVAMLTFGVALIAGLWFIGKEVIQTVGTNLTKIHPASGFSAELAAAAVVLMASMLGIPVSSTHILIGAVLGIGLVNREANWALMKPIALAWVITLPVAGVLSSLIYLSFINIF